MFQIIDGGKPVKSRQPLINFQTFEDPYKRLFEAAQDGILIIDAQTGEISDVNPFLTNILGYSHAEIIGKSIWELDIFKDIEDGRKSFKQLQTREYIHCEDLPLKAKDGRIIHVEFVSNVYQVNGEKVIQCNIHDISKRKHVEEEKEKLIGELKDALAKIKKVGGLLPICSSCKKIRDDDGYWQKIEQYICDHSEANFTHSICPECRDKLYPQHLSPKAKQRQSGSRTGHDGGRGREEQHPE